MTTKTKVIVAGAGIAGPVLALFLQTKGYEPVIYEKVGGHADVGIAIGLGPNGLRVLNLIPGLVDKIAGCQLENFVHCSVVPGDEGVLVETDLTWMQSCTGFGLLAVQRSAFHQTLIEVAERSGIRIHWGHQLVGIVERNDHVDVTFANGVTDSASFVIGCDGLRSDTRSYLFGREDANYTGLTQTGGISPIPESMKQPQIISFYGDGACLIAMTISRTHMAWARVKRPLNIVLPGNSTMNECRLSQAEGEEKESWRAVDELRQDDFKRSPYSKWSLGAGELVRTAERIVKYGLYERPMLRTWHKGRVVLVGDAAHPTSPHLGQGANQAFEDIYHLVRSLVRHNPGALPPSTNMLATVFTEYTAVRLTTTSKLVSDSRLSGATNLVRRNEACKKRNNAIRNRGMDLETWKASRLELYMQPFVGQSEI